ncbi:DUF6064 family protein [aff. Roholtiella sp. LEGE 12411]|uniref:DUF6064 family protein n=1 Tax=aff. Roholtiella sp. LEGE 12411 TaxID=1828822 RepID=UPI0030DCB7E5
MGIQCVTECCTGRVLFYPHHAIYPLIGYSLERTFPSLPTFGIPCPTTIFTFGLLFWTNKKFPSSLLIVLIFIFQVG